MKYEKRQDKLIEFVKKQKEPFCTHDVERELGFDPHCIGVFLSALETPTKHRPAYVIRVGEKSSCPLQTTIHTFWNYHDGNKVEARRSAIVGMQITKEFENKLKVQKADYEKKLNRHTTKKKLRSTDQLAGMVMDYLKIHRYARITPMVKAMKMDRKTLTTHLNKLIKSGLVDHIRYGRYVLISKPMVLQRPVTAPIPETFRSSEYLDLTNIDKQDKFMYRLVDLVCEAWQEMRREHADKR